jgi:hypothetical protein
MEVKRHAHFDPPDLPPVMVVEATPTGWRGLTMDGVVLNVESSSGHAIEIPFGGRVAVTRNGEHIGYRAVPDRVSPGMIDRYLRCFNISRSGVARGHLSNALSAIETAASFAPTLAAQYNRGMILLEMGQWQEGFAEYMRAMEYPGSMFARPQYRACIEYGLMCWRGEDIRNKRLLLIHDHGFGDSIMMLRYVPILKMMGADVLIWVPSELERLAMQCAPVVREIVGTHYFCPLLFLLGVLNQTPETIPLYKYLDVERRLMPKWREWFGGERTGVAWSPGVTHENDYPRAIGLANLRKAKALLRDRMVSVQLVPEQERGSADSLGVINSPFDDFADCAAAMMCCNRIVTIDTAAVHLAGAIGHPNVALLLSHWASWRWLSPLYPNVRICRQDTPGDWDSALAKL